MSKVFAAFFYGQYGLVFSVGVARMSQRAKTDLGITTKCFNYEEFEVALRMIEQARRDGCRIALIGYSLGNTTATYLQRRTHVDLLLAIAMSSYAGPNNHAIVHAHTKRSVLWRGDGALSCAGGDLGFDVVHDIHRVPHLLMDWAPTVTNGVLDELAALLKAH